MRRIGFLLLIALTALPAGGITYQWTNTLGGDYSGVANWSPHGMPGPNDAANITTPGTYTITSSNNAAFSSLTLGASSGVQTLVYGLGSSCTMLGTVKSNGVLVITNGGIQGGLTVEEGGQLQVTGAPSKLLYSFSLTNRGAVTWSGGSCSVGGTTVSNGGLWQITSDSGISYGGYTTPTWVNAGTLRKSGGTATTSISGFNFVNQPGGVVDVLSGTLQIGGPGTNILGGSLTVTTPGFLNLIGIWTDAGGTTSGTGISQFGSGTLILRTNIIPGLRLLGGDIYLGNTFQQAGAITNLTLDGATLRGTNKINNGTLTLNSGDLVDQLTVQPAGQLVFATGGSKLLYTSTIFNQGTVAWTGGSLNFGGTPGTVVSNGGLWQIAGDVSMSWGGGLVPNWTNTGILRKTTGSGAAQISGVNFINQPGGLVEALSGTLRFTGGNLSEFGGTFNATSPGLIEITGGTWTDSGGTATGTGTNRLNGGTFNFRTNTIPGLRLYSGNVYVTGTNTFQQAGAITNLTLDGVTLLGTNYVGNGSLTVNGGALAGRLTVATNGQLVLATTNGKLLYSLNLINQGSVLWSGGSLSVGSTPPTVISNGGLWQLTSDDVMSYGGGLTPVWTNSGTLRKVSGSGISSVAGMSFYNQPSGLVQVDSGTLQLTSTTTNTAGTLRLNGGKLSANGTLAVSGGTLDGTGAVGANALSGGLISPGQGGPGRLSFTSDLNLGANAALLLDGTGIVPGTGYDQLSVTDAVALGNCALQVASLPSVPTGTTFVIINNDGAEAVTGTFKGLPENAVLLVNNQLFRVSYHAGTGNDVTLTQVSNTNAQPRFSGVTRLANGVIQLAATGVAGLTYTVQANTNLATTDWTNLGSTTADAAGNAPFTDPAATNFPARFYRFVWP